MRPYFAIIKDAFREALASRTLWILLILISLFLIFLAPLSYNETLSGGIAFSDVKDWKALMARILRDEESDRPSPGKHIMTQLEDDRLIDSMRALAEEDVSKISEEETLNKSIESSGEESDDLVLHPGMLSIFLQQGLEQAMTRDSFYDEPSWKSKRMRAEVTEILEQGDWKEDEIKYRNRLLLEEAYPDLIHPVPPRSYQMTYLGYEIPGKFAMRRVDFFESVQSIVLFSLLFLFGTAGILIAIMVTAPIIPQTFDAGSLSLLLSKPISRSLMFISQYVGGLAFIGILASYTFAGLCLILGLRLGYWNAKILYYIPCFVFIFAVYYAVSCLVSLIWRSTSLSIILTIVFWLCCAGVGLTKFVCDMPLSQLETRSVISANDNVFALRKQGNVLVWNEAESDWTESYHDSSNAGTLSIHGPVYDQKRNRLVSQDGFFGGGPMPVNLLPELRFAGPDDGWSRHVGSQLPVGVLDIQPHPDEGFVVFAVSGIHRLTGDLKIPDDAALEDGKPKRKKRFAGPGAGGFMKMFGRNISATADDFEQIGPDRGYSLFSPWASAVNQTNGDITVYSRGIVSLFRRTDKDYSLVQRRELDGASEQKVELGFGGDTILLSRDDDGVIVLDGNSLEEKKRQSVEGGSVLKSIEFNNDGSLAAMVLQNQKLLMYDAKQGSFFRPSVPSRDKVYAAAFGADNQLVYSDRWLVVRQVDTGSMNPTGAYSAKSTGFTWFYRYILTPIHTIFPKPGKLNNTAQFLVTGDDTREDYSLSMMRMIPMGNIADTFEDEFARVYLDPWPPVWNGLIFIAVVLGIGCWYIERQQY